MEDRNLLILGSGFAGSGKSTRQKRLFQTLKKSFPHLNCVYIDKDVIAATLLGKEQYFTEYYDKYVHHQSYQLMISLAREHLKINKTNNVIILDGIFGDKINEYVKDLLGFKEFDVKLIHFHCSGKKQLERLETRGYERDVRHITDFTEFRKTQIKNHLLGLSQLSQYCFIDTEKDGDIDDNIQQIVQHLKSPCTVQLIPQITKDISVPSVNEAMEGAASFKVFLDKIKQESKRYHQHRLFGMPTDEQSEQPKTSHLIRARL